MSVINFGPLEQYAPGRYQSTRGFQVHEIQDVDKQYLQEAQDFIQNNRRGTKQFNKKAFEAWAADPKRRIRLTKPAHVNMLFENVVARIVEADQLKQSHAEMDTSVAPMQRDPAQSLRDAEIFECLLGIIYDLEADASLTSTSVVNTLRAEVSGLGGLWGVSPQFYPPLLTRGGVWGFPPQVEENGREEFLGPAPVTDEELFFALWCWNSNVFGEQLERERAHLLSAYKALGVVQPDLKYPFGTYENAVRLISEANVKHSLRMSEPDVDWLAEYFVELHPLRRTEFEYVGSPYYLAKQRQRALDAFRFSRKVEHRVATPSPEASHNTARVDVPDEVEPTVDAANALLKLWGVLPPMFDTADTAASKPKRKGRGEWKWYKETRQHALNWVAAHRGTDAKLPQSDFKKFTVACVESNPTWVLDLDNKEKACELLFDHVQRKLLNDAAARKKRMNAAANAAAAAAAPIEAF
jgi:hypothetical protein